MASPRSTRREARAFDWGAGASLERPSAFFRPDAEAQASAERKRRKRQRGRTAMIVTALAIGVFIALLVEIAHVLRIGSF